MTFVESMSTFLQRLKTHLFPKSFPSYYLDAKYHLSWTLYWYLPLKPLLKFALLVYKALSH